MTALWTIAGGACAAIISALVWAAFLIIDIHRINRGNIQECDE